MSDTKVYEREMVRLFAEMCNGFEAGSYLRLIDCVHHSTLGLRVTKKNLVEELAEGVEVALRRCRLGLEWCGLILFIVKLYRNMLLDGKIVPRRAFKTLLQGRLGVAVCLAVEAPRDAQLRELVPHNLFEARDYSQA